MSNKMKKFSIITISYNQGRYLRDCIESVLHQSDVEIEYIIVDPGSIDNSREIINSYGDKIIKIYEKDAGPADGLNKGFAIATGDIFGYLNSDDTLLPNSLKKVSTFFKESNADVIHGHALLTNAEGVVIRRLFTDKFELKAASYGACIMIQPSAFFTMEAYKSTPGFNINNKSNWDGELFIEMGLSNNKFLKVNEFFSTYRIHENSITGTGKFLEKHISYQNLMYEKITQLPIEHKSTLKSKYFKLRRRILNYKDSIERLRFGSVFGINSK